MALSPIHWIEGRALRLMDDGMEHAAATKQAKGEWDALSHAERALYLAPPPCRPCFEVMSERRGQN